jgi:2-C-methyl-D-erythritol 4-phosphate cytidylyltransferase
VSAAEAVWAVVPAGGQGVRMGQKKQDLLLAGRPVLRWTLDVFEPARSSRGSWSRSRPRTCPPGRIASPIARRSERCRGAPRARSRCAAPSPPSADIAWIVVHDGVRPYVTAELIRAS